ncbi:hypothetical protein N0V95_005539 [Ascochyta clinopodiicola]|nr:hypothetical protein N0V95_005539 [Ascochyta clinopodiicola]
MGDIHEPTTVKRPGIAVVMPKLHKDTHENRALFKRWTRLHLRDIVSFPKHKDLGGISTILRYIRTDTDGGEEYFLTNHLDDLGLLGAELFQKTSHRLDLENTRELKEGEEAVLEPGDHRIGTDPMIFSVAVPVANVFEEYTDSELITHLHGHYYTMLTSVVQIM